MTSPDGDDDDWRSSCDTGPVRVTLRGARRPGHALCTSWSAARGCPGPAPPTWDASPAPEAARYLLALATPVGRRRRRIGRSSPPRSPTASRPGRTCLRLARDADVAGATRRSAVFWVSQAAEAGGHPWTRLAGGRGLPRPRGPRAGSVRIVAAPARRGSPDPDPHRAHRTEIPRSGAGRSSGSGQSNDPRALALFEDLLTKP